VAPAPSLISLGKIVKTQGTRGAFRVFPHGGDSENLDSLERVTLAAPGGRQWETRVTECRRKGSLFIFTVEGVDSIEDAEKLVGGEVLADESDLAPLEDGEFYWYEIVGMEVVTDEGRRLGVVDAIMPTGANDVLQVLDGKREILLPHIPDVVLAIDREARRVTVHLLPGLL